MKTSENNSNSMIIMFWSIPSCTMLKAYKAKSDTLNQAIKEVANEGGYQMIFDASTSILLYAEDNADVSDAVKTKLGIL